jgi:hypothetical protein
MLVVKIIVGILLVIGIVLFIADIKIKDKDDY